MANYVDFTKYLRDKYDSDESDEHLPASSHYVACYGKEIGHFEPGHLRKVITQFKDTAAESDCKILLIFDSSAKHKYRTDDLSDIDVEIKFVPFWLLWTHLAHVFLNQASKHTNSVSDKFLFMPGKIDKLPRLAVLQAMHRNNWFDYNIAKWSLVTPGNGEYQDRVAQLLEHWEPHHRPSIEQLVSYNRELDYNLELHHNQTGFHLTGVPYDVSIYNDVGFTIVAETEWSTNQSLWLNGTDWLTEKTYRSIYNCVPMINICSGNNTLKKLGFYTFEDLYSVEHFGSNDKDHVFDTDKFYVNLTTAVNNMKTAVVDHSAEIHHRVTHNKVHMIQLAQNIVDDFADNEFNSRTFADWILKDCSYPNCNSGKSNDPDYDFVFNN